MNTIDHLKTSHIKTRQYYNRQLFNVDEFIFYIEDAINGLLGNSRIDLTSLEKEIRNFVMIVNLFGYASTKIANLMRRHSAELDTLDKDGSKRQTIPASDTFALDYITETIGRRHEKLYRTPLPKLQSNQGIQPTDIPESWHAITLNDGTTLNIETIASAVLEYERSYIRTLSESGTLPILQNIQKIFADVHYENPTEATLNEALEKIVMYYLNEYEISAVLLPFHGISDGLSANIDKIYEKYTFGKNLQLKKTAKLIMALFQNGNSPKQPSHTRTTKHRTDKKIGNPKLNALINELHEAIASQEESQDASVEEENTNITKLHEEKDVHPKAEDSGQSSAGIEKKDALASIVSKPQIFESTDTSDINVSSTGEVQDEALSSEQIFEKYCQKRISDSLYQIAGDMYLKKEHDRWIIVMQDGYKTIGKGEDAFDEPVYKRVSKTPYFIVAKTEHLQSGDQGVQLVAVNNNKQEDYTSLTLGEADSKKVKSVLRNKGILIESPKLNADYIDYMYQTVSRQLFISDEVGWVEHAGQFGFVLPQKFGIGISGLEYSGKNQRLLHAIETRGDLEEWLSIFKFLDLEKAHPRIAFLLFSSLLPLFANFHDTFEGFVINITPDYTEGKGSSNGKTTVQQLMLSLQGSVEHWHTNWNKTALAMEEYLYTNVGAYFDDTSKTKMKPQELEDLIYSISDAESRGSSRQSTRTRKTVMYSTGEKDFLQHTGKDGVYVRYVDIGIKRNDYGSDDPDETRKIVDHIKKTVVSNYGFVYPEAIRIFLENRDRILQKTDKYIEEMAQYGQYDNASRIAKRYAMIAVCGEVFIEVMRGLTGNKDLYRSLDPFAISLDMFRVHDNKLVEMEQTQETVSVDLLSELLNKFSVDEQNNLYDSEGNIVGFTKGEDFYIRSKEVTKHLPDGMTKAKFKNSIDKALIIDTGKNVTRKHIEQGKAIRYDIFKRPTTV